MTTRIAINGFGRIGRLTLRAILELYPDDLEVVAINDIADAQTNAYLFKYDSNYGPFPGQVDVSEDTTTINDHPLRVFSVREPAAIPWGEVAADLVIESTGRFNDGKKAAAHFSSSVKKVIISAPAKNVDLTVVLGVNEGRYDPGRHHTVSNTSCTTNALAPVAKVLNDHFGIRKGLLTTVHAYTSSQQLLDLATKRLRRSRSGAVNIVPATTGATTGVETVLPELKGRFTGMAFRVPVSTVSVIDFTVQLEHSASVDEVNRAMRDAAGGPMKGIVAYSDDPLVSTDLKRNPHSSIFSAADTMALDDMVKVVSWYDNEWAYACRVADLAHLVAAKIPVLAGSERK